MVARFVRGESCSPGGLSGSGAVLQATSLGGLSVGLSSVASGGVLSIPPYIGGCLAGGNIPVPVNEAIPGGFGPTGTAVPAVAADKPKAGLRGPRNAPTRPTAGCGWSGNPNGWSTALSSKSSSFVGFLNPEPRQPTVTCRPKLVCPVS